MPPPPPAPPKHSGGPSILLLFIIVVALLGIALWFWPVLQNGSGSHENTTFLMRSEDGTSAWYRLSGTTLSPVVPVTATSSGGAVTIVESSEGLPVGTPVLARFTDLPGTRFGLLRSDNYFTALTTGSADRRGLAVRPDGLAAFSYSVASQGASALSSWHVGAVNVATNSLNLTDLGVGYGPAFAMSGNILALAPEGLVEINAETGAHKTILPASDDFTGTFAVAPGGSFAVMKNQVTNTDDVFWINSANPEDISYAGSLPAMPQGLGIVSPSEFVAQTSANAATLYAVSKSAITPGVSLTISR